MNTGIRDCAKQVIKFSEVVSSKPEFRQQQRGSSDPAYELVHLLIERSVNEYVI